MSNEQGIKNDGEHGKQTGLGLWRIHAVGHRLDRPISLSRDSGNGGDVGAARMRDVRGRGCEADLDGRRVN